MRWTKTMDGEVYVADEPTVKVGRSDIEFLKEQVGGSKRKRVRLCAHKDLNDKLHEMFIVLGKETYIRPHKHVNKAESLQVIEGLADVVFFDEAGGITDVIPLGPYLSARRFYYRIDEPIYHSLVIHSDFLVFHESAQGPFVKSDNILAPWAPDEGETAAVKGFREHLTRAVGKFVPPHGEHS